jgi:hypothetical protein
LVVHNTPHVNSGKRNKQLTRTIFALLLALLAGSAIANDVPVAIRPVFTPGDVFVYADRFESVACKRWEVRSVEDGGLSTLQCGDNTAYFAAKSGALVKIAKSDGTEILSYAPSAPEMPFPLEIGKSWGGRFELTSIDEPVSPTISESCTITAYETVKVVAGQFPAFRFECTDAWSYGLLHGSAASTGWYAPLAKSVVKVVNDTDSDWNMELVSYRFE